MLNKLVPFAVGMSTAFSVATAGPVIVPARPVIAAPRVVPPPPRPVVPPPAHGAETAPQTGGGGGGGQKPPAKTGQGGDDGIPPSHSSAFSTNPALNPVLKPRSAPVVPSSTGSASASQQAISVSYTANQVSCVMRVFDQLEIGQKLAHNDRVALAKRTLDQARSKKSTHEQAIIQSKPCLDAR